MQKELQIDPGLEMALAARLTEAAELQEKSDRLKAEIATAAQQLSGAGVSAVRGGAGDRKAFQGLKAKLTSDREEIEYVDQALRAIDAEISQLQENISAARLCAAKATLGEYLRAEIGPILDGIQKALAAAAVGVEQLENLRKEVQESDSYRALPSAAQDRIIMYFSAPEHLIVGLVPAPLQIMIRSLKYRTLEEANQARRNLEFAFTDGIKVLPSAVAAE